VKGLVLAGGHGTRLRPLTFTGNKHMLPVANRPILYYALQNLADAGIHDVAIVLGPIHEGIREAIGDGASFGLNVKYIFQGEPKGLAHAVLCSRKFLESEPFLMHLGDNLLQSGVGQFLSRYETDRPDAVVGATRVAHPEHYGVVELSQGRIVSIEEKPSHPKSHLALIGVYLFTESIHKVIRRLAPSPRGELEITEAIWQLCASGRNVSVLDVQGWWKDTGHPNDLLEANELTLRSLPPASFVNQGSVSAGVTIEGAIGIGPGTIVEPGVHLIGPTLIGSNARIRSGSRIGPYSAIGNLAVVSRGSVRRSIVMDGAFIDSVAIANSLVGRNVEIRASEPTGKEVTLTIGDSSRVAL